MNGSRSTYMRKGYLLTALAAAVLLAASSGTAYAQRVTIGFVNTSGEISEEGASERQLPGGPAEDHGAGSGPPLRAASARTDIRRPASGASQPTTRTNATALTITANKPDVQIAHS